MRVAIGSDHAGYEQKEQLKGHLASRGIDVEDVGTFSAGESVDYPDYAFAVAARVASGDAEFGVLVCGTGLGMAIAANKVDGVRAVSVVSPKFAELARAHNDANVVTVSGRFVAEEDNKQVIDAFLGTPFEGGRHAGRVEKINRKRS
ncbi:MAG: ribose 5-phosphate isomerase B [Coriobacteriia bacterium]|nr:ribose 5-phosphate isomerase B [Coriobacteriia bacterium]